MVEASPWGGLFAARRASRSPDAQGSSQWPGTSSGSYPVFRDTRFGLKRSPGPTQQVVRGQGCRHGGSPRILTVNISLRQQRIIVVIGFVLVAVGWLAFTTNIWSNSPPSWTGADLINGLGNIIGYGVLAVAAWAWFRWIEGSTVALPDMTRLLRLFAVGNLFLSIGVMAAAYEMTHLAISVPFAGHTEIASLAWYILQAVGFLLVSVAYWSASIRLQRVPAEASLPSAESVTV